MVIIRPSSRSHKSGTKSCAIRCINVTFKRLSTNTAIRNRPAGPSRAVSGGSMLLSRATFRTGILDFAHLSSTAVTTRHNFDSSRCLHKPRIIQITCYSCPSSAFSKARQSRKIILGPYGLFEHDLRPMSRLLSLASRLLTFRKGPEPPGISGVFEHLVPVAHHPERTQPFQTLELFDAQECPWESAIIVEALCGC